MIATHGVPLKPLRATAIASSSANDAHHGPSPNKTETTSAGKQSPRNSDAPSKNSASSRSRLTPRKPKAASSAPGAPVRTVWSRRTASGSRTTLAEANTVLAALLRRLQPAFRPRRRRIRAPNFRSLPRRFDLDRCLAFRYQRVVHADHTVTLAPTRSRCPIARSARGYAGETVELSHQLDGRLRVFAEINSSATMPPAAGTTRPTPPCPPLTTAQKRKTPMPRIYNLGGRPRFSGRYLNDRG